MDLVSLIEAALVAGAAASTQDITSQTIKDAYTHLRTLLNHFFAEKPKAQDILDEHASDPETYEKPVKKMLTEAHVDQEADLLTAAQCIIALIQQSPQIGIGKYTIQNTGTVQGQNIADHQEIHQQFGNPPKA